MKRRMTIAAMVLLAAGAAWYFAYVRPRATRESALIYLVRSVVAKEIRRSRLAEELISAAIELDDPELALRGRIWRVAELFEGVGARGGYICSMADHFFELPKSKLQVFAAAARECSY